MIRGINKAQKDDAYRLLQCLTVASRPLRVEELAELLAFDFEGSSSGGIPKLREDWRWDDEEEAVLSTCSSLITIVRNGDSRVVQFSHFSVKEYLMSPRLALSPHADVSRFHIDLEPAHTIMAQACLATLLRVDEHAGNSGAKRSPLVQYAAHHWVDHAQSEMVSSRVRDGMDDLFDSSKPHFAAWLQVHDVDEDWVNFTSYGGEDCRGSPLYYAAFCGLYDLAERLIMKHPEQVNALSGHIRFPLPAALYKRHFRLADLLHKHGADVDCPGSSNVFPTPLAAATIVGGVDVMRWLLNHGADPNAQGDSGYTALDTAAVNKKIEEVQVLLEYNADVNFQDCQGETPLYSAMYYGVWQRQETVIVARRLLEHGADPNICGNRGTPLLHLASSRGWLEGARLLLNYEAKVDEKDGEGRTP